VEGGELPIYQGTLSAIDRSGVDCHMGPAMNCTFATGSYYYPDEVGTG
jgi:hypothetical protein